MDDVTIYSLIGRCGIMCYNNYLHCSTFVFKIMRTLYKYVLLLLFVNEPTYSRVSRLNFKLCSVIVQSDNLSDTKSF